MATACPNCGSTDTQAGLNLNTCLSCGRLFDFSGNLAQPGLDDAGREATMRSLETNEGLNLVGNQADLQRAGAVGQFNDAITQAEDQMGATSSGDQALPGEPATSGATTNETPAPTTSGADTSSTASTPTDTSASKSNG